MGNFKLIFIAASASFLVACSATKNSLLTDYSAKDPCAETSCLTRTAVDSDLYIQPTLSSIAIKKGTVMAEVDGNCTPSYYDAHKIIVKVYAGAYASGTPISENDSYITATNGHMLTENSKFYPQCIRGKFSFLLPLFNPSSPATILTAVLVQFYIQASDAKKGEVTSPVASSTITILP